MKKIIFFLAISIGTVSGAHAQFCGQSRFSCTPTFTPSITATFTKTPTATPTGSATPTPTGSATPTKTPTGSATPTKTNTPTKTATPTKTPTPTATIVPTQAVAYVSGTNTTKIYSGLNGFTVNPLVIGTSLYSESTSNTRQNIFDNPGGFFISTDVSDFGSGTLLGLDGDGNFLMNSSGVGDFTTVDDVNITSDNGDINLSASSGNFDVSALTASIQTTPTYSGPITTLASIVSTPVVWTIKNGAVIRHTP